MGYSGIFLLLTFYELFTAILCGRFFRNGLEHFY